MKMASWMAAAGLGAAAAAAAPTLDECVRTALAENPDLAAAEARIAAARAAARQARSAWWPHVGASAGHARTDNPPQAFMMSLNQRSLDMRDPAFDPNRPDDTGNTRLTVGLKFALADFGRRASGVAAADAMAAARAAASAAVRNHLVHEVTRAYYGALQAREFADVQAAQIRSLEESLRVARERLDRGAAIRSDVLSLEVRLAEAREDWVRARNGAALAVAALNTAIGRDLVPEDGPAAVDTSVAPTAPQPPDESALRDHPASRAAAAAAEARRAAWRRARADFRPAISAMASSDWDSEDFGEFEQSYMAGVVAEIEIFDGARRRAAADEARAEAEAAEAEARQVLDRLRLDLRRAAIAVREARERWDVTARSEESADEALRMTKARYEQGAADLAELINAEAARASIRSRRVAALYDYLVALSDQDRALGRLAGR